MTKITDERLADAEWLEHAARYFEKPNPGSEEAIERGCKCPVIDNHHGKGVPHGKDDAPLFWVSERCAMHWEEQKENRT